MSGNQLFCAFQVKWVMLLFIFENSLVIVKVKEYENSWNLLQTVWVFWWHSVAFTMDYKTLQIFNHHAAFWKSENDFTLEIRQISPVKSGGFHPWNLADFTCEIRWISPVKSSRFHPWNLADFTHEIHIKSAGFHLKSVRNPPDFMKSAGFHGMWAFAWWSSIGLSFERPTRGFPIRLLG